MQVQLDYLRKEQEEASGSREGEGARLKALIGKERSEATRAVSEARALVKTLKAELQDAKAKARKYGAAAKKLKEQFKAKLGWDSMDTINHAHQP